MSRMKTILPLQGFCAMLWAIAIGLCAPTSFAQNSSSAASQTQWVDAWAVSFIPTLLNGTVQNVPTFDNQTLRLFVFPKLGGSALRVKLTNKYSAVPLVIGGAHVALRSATSGGAADSAIDPTTDRVLTFNGAKTLTLEPGQETWSDPVTLTVKQHQDVAISLFLPQSIKPTAFHLTGLKSNSISSAPGDHTGDASWSDPAGSGPRPRVTTMYFFVSGLQVMAPARTKVIVTLGDSITDGATSANDANGSWPDVLSKRLPALRDGTPVSVINMGIGSNRIIASDAAGPAGVSRFQDDVLSRPNVSHLIVMEGINDISYEQAPAEKLIAAYQQIIAQAHARGIKVYGATLLPIQNSRKDTPANEATRQAVNKWIKESKAYDAVLDFEKVVQDPENPLRIRKDLTSDYVHPNTLGYKLMAESIDLKLFD